MVTNEKNALQAVHHLLHHGRSLTGEGTSSRMLFAYFDELDGLMGYIISWHGSDKSAFFEQELERVCVNFNARHIFENFKRN